ncbi:MAG: MBL fold metallo-hydrolase [Hyphomicrobiales bacterium]
MRPAPNLFAFYDGRVEGVRAYGAEANWLDDGAYSLGACSYAIVDGAEALMFDTHISCPHARIIRRTLADAGAASLRVVLSHWHADHVAGNEVFADCEIISNTLTAQTLAANKEAIEARKPAVKPLILPNRTYTGQLTLHVGTIPVELRQADIHSHDGSVLLLPDRGLMLAGDTLEDPITYVSEPGRLATHLVDLRRMASWDIRSILPNHGAPEVIEGGGYGPSLIDATRRYVEKLMRCPAEPELAQQDLRSFAPEDFASGSIRYFPAYEAVHHRNVRSVTSNMVGR